MTTEQRANPGFERAVRESRNVPRDGESHQSERKQKHRKSVKRERNTRVTERLVSRTEQWQVEHDLAEISFVLVQRQIQRGRDGFCVSTGS